MYDVVALGELLIDFTQKDGKEMSFMANPGGAPGNVLSTLSKLGKKTAFIGKVGKDKFGEFLFEILKQNNVDTTGLVFAEKEFTTLAFVSIDNEGNRSFSFARNNSADVMLNKKELKLPLIKNSKIFHCGSLSLTDKNVRQATFKALKFAKKNKVCISVDPNLRLNLWNSADEAKKAIISILKYADIIKISDYEAEFLFGKMDINSVVQIIYKNFNPKVVLITCGKDGAYIATKNDICYVSCIEGIKTVDTTGAGDCFCGAALSQLLDIDLDFNKLTPKKMQSVLEYANIAANLSTTKYGAIPSIPNISEIQSYYTNDEADVE